MLKDLFLLAKPKTTSFTITDIYSSNVTMYITGDNYHSADLYDQNDVYTNKAILLSSLAIGDPYAGYFNGESMLSITDDPTLEFGSGDFTIECWIQPENLIFTNGLVGEYFNGGTTPVLTRVEGPLNFSWYPEAPGPGVNADYFQAVWTGGLTAQNTEVVTFTMSCDDNASLAINGVTIINMPIGTQTTTYQLCAGQFYDFYAYLGENSGAAAISLQWSSASITQQVIPLSSFFAYPRKTILSKDVNTRINSGNLELSVLPNNKIEFYCNPNSADTTGRVTLTSKTSVQNRTWTHIAVSRSGYNWRLFVNGVLESDSVSSVAFRDSSNPLYIGCSLYRSAAQQFWKGYISRLRITKAQALYTTNFTPASSNLSTISNGGALPSTIPFASNVSLLALQGGSVYEDESTYSKSISRTGPVGMTKYQALKFSERIPVGGISPFSNDPGYWSGHFYDGDHLQINSTVGIGNGEFTIECWINPSKNQSGHSNKNFIVADYYHQTSPTYGWWLEYDSSTKQVNLATIYDNANSWSAGTSADSISPDTWTHIAVSRGADSIVRFFVNGKLNSSTTYSGTIYDYSTVRIGNSFLDGLQWKYHGYISNLRITKQALYTGNFVPSTIPLTTTTNGNATGSVINPTAANVWLLTLQDNNFRDRGPSNRTLESGGGSPSVHYYNPFTLFNLRNQQDLSSGYFDESRAYSYLTLPTSNDLVFGTGDFTIEGWINSPTYVGVNVIFQTQGSNDPGAVYLCTDGGLLKFAQFINGSRTEISSTTLIPNSWYHVAATRSSGTARLFVNGVLQSSSTTALNGNFTTNNFPLIGANHSALGQTFNGYLSNLRIVKGVAVYTGTFTPPRAPVKNSGPASIGSYASTTNVNTTFPSSQCSVLLDFDKTGVADYSGNTAISTYAQARTSYARSKWTNKESLYFDATSFLTSTFNSNFGTGPFSVEAWIYPADASTKWTLIDSRNSLQTSNWAFGQTSVDGRLSWWNGTTHLISAPSQSVTTSAWNHVIYSRSNDMGRMYCNGVLVASAADTTNYVNTATFSTMGYIGSNYNNTLPYRGYIDDLRILTGTVRTSASSYAIPSREFNLSRYASSLPISSPVNTFSRFWYLKMSGDGGTIGTIDYDSSGKLFTSQNSGNAFGARSIGWHIGYAMSRDGNIQYFCVHPGGQVYKSTDKGVTFVQVGTAGNYGCACSGDGNVVLSWGQGWPSKSTDGGATWAGLPATGAAGGWPQVEESVALSQDGRVMLIASKGVYDPFTTTRLSRSTDYGVNWSLTETARSWSSLAMTPDGTKMVAAVGRGTPGQLYVSTDTGATWTPRQSNKNWNSVAISDDGQTIVASVSEEYLYYSKNGGRNWHTIFDRELWSQVEVTADGKQLIAIRSDNGGMSKYSLEPYYINYAVVAGGGGVGGQTNCAYRGGGGAGGVRSGLLVANPGSYSVIVGAGGAGGATGNVQGAQGGTSIFGNLSAAGGGYGGGSWVVSGNPGYEAGGPGGSGGGGSMTAGGGAGNTPSTDPRQGYNGGTGGNSGGGCIGTSGGGGGGAGTQGGNGFGGMAGPGGTGIPNPVPGSTHGELILGSYYLAGGGAGQGNTGEISPGLGNTRAANSGGGGHNTGAGGVISGQSGVVIISYLSGQIVASGGTITYNGRYTVHTFTSSGTFRIL
jgi:hypothetical protein